MKLLTQAAAALALAAALPAVAPAQQQPETAAFVVTIGRDTLAVERYTRTADRLTGEVVARSPRTVVRGYTATLRPDGSISRLEMTSRTPGGGAPPVTSTLEFVGDSAVTRVQRGDSTTVLRVAAGERPIVVVGNSYATYEQAMMHARALGVDSLGGTLIFVGANQTFPMSIRRTGADSVELVNIAGLQRAATDAQGRLLGLDGLESTQKFIVTRLPTIDTGAFAAEFARRDAAGQAMGTLSPRDSAVAHVAGAHVVVDYGRPAKRGRQIMGQVVPWGQVWRTGANAATVLRTSRDLEIGGAAVPAGAYTLWTIPQRDGWTLIVNKETGQWGTEYKESEDLVRIPIRVRSVSPAVEQFTIAIDPSDSGGTLRMAWDDTEAYVPFTVK